MHSSAELAPSPCSRHPGGASNFARKDFSAKVLQRLIGSAWALPGPGAGKTPPPPVTSEGMRKNEAALRKGIIRVQLPQNGEREWTEPAPLLYLPRNTGTLTNPKSELFLHGPDRQNQPKPKSSGGQMLRSARVSHLQRHRIHHVFRFSEGPNET